MNRKEYAEYHKSCCSKMVSITEAKNHDYAGATSNDPFSNFSANERIGIMSTEQAILGRIMDKVSRLNSFLKMGTLQVKDESMEDTCLDLANLSIIFCAQTKKRKQEKTQADEYEKPKESSGLCNCEKILDSLADCSGKFEDECAVVEKNMEIDNKGEGRVKVKIFNEKDNQGLSFEGDFVSFKQENGFDEKFEKNGQVRTEIRICEGFKEWDDFKNALDLEKELFNVNDFTEDLISSCLFGFEIVSKCSKKIFSNIMSRATEYFYNDELDVEFTQENMALFADRVYTDNKEYIGSKFHHDFAHMIADKMWKYGLLAPGKDGKDLDAGIWNEVFHDTEDH